ncbi:Uncharacterised protein [Chromobacterium violaceum]|uniref:Uncharacterized protein n=2 Tax=Chromobacterium violaceum TaxID=536 RepID=A0A3S4HN62_CHRVL|nr:Uncharacterised protein [Chromobacterium violaceum]
MLNFVNNPYEKLFPTCNRIRRIMKKLLVALFSLLTLFASQAAVARQAPLNMPARVELSSPRGDMLKTKALLFKASASLGWEMTGDVPGKLTLKYNKGEKHQAVINAIYDGNGYTLQFVSSENLNYERKDNGVEMIHPNFNRWMANLVKYIGIADGESAIASGMPSAAPASAAK